MEKDLLILSDGSTWRFASVCHGTALAGDRADPGDGNLLPIREIIPSVDEAVFSALQRAGEQLPEKLTLWRPVR